MMKQDVDDEDEGRKTSKVPVDQFTLNRYTANVFYGIMPDTGAARLSTAGFAQFRAL